jgi:hypothetical protein
MNFLPHAECVRPPRVALVESPYGALWGPPGNRQYQSTLIFYVLDALQSTTEPGSILTFPFAWTDPIACDNCLTT